MPPESPALDPSGNRIKKKSRRPKHSCFECRRKKVRCVFTPENPTTCSECLSRDSTCVDQDDGDPNVVLDNRKSMRERLSRVEALLQYAIDGSQGQHMLSTVQCSVVSAPSGPTGAALVASNEDPSPTDLDPLFASLSNSVSRHDEQPLSISEQVFSSAEPFGVTHLLPSLGYDGPATGYKAEATRKVLLALLPPKAEVLEQIRHGGNWWLHWDKSCNPSYRMKHATFESFATYAMAEGTPVEIAILSMCSALHTNQSSFNRNPATRNLVDRVPGAIERLIISDDLYMSRIEGLECSLLLGKYYSDIGDLRRAWQVFRRGISSAQMMGLHQHRVTPIQEAVWWALYQSDRFYSLMLRLPYGISDTHCNLLCEGRDLGLDKTTKGFIAGMARKACMIIDNSQSLDESMATLLEVDRQLTAFAGEMPSQFWEIPTMTFWERQERIMGQLVYYQTKIILHLPYTLKAIQTGDGYQYSRHTCLRSASESLRLYHQVRTAAEIGGHPFRSIDFTGYIASVLVALELLSHDTASDSNSHIRTCEDPGEADWDLISRTMIAYQAVVNEKGRALVRQFYNGLEQLVGLRHARSDGGHGTKVMLPYFGTICIYPVENASQQQTTATHSPSLGALTWRNMSAAEFPQPPIPSQGRENHIHLDGVFMDPPYYDQPSAMDHRDRNRLSQSNIAPMDSEQELAWLMSDTQASLPYSFEFL